MPMDNISMCSNTLYISKMDARSKFEVGDSLNNDVMKSFQVNK